MRDGASDLTDLRTEQCLGHETKLKLQVRIRELEAENAELRAKLNVSVEGSKDETGIIDEASTRHSLVD